MIFYHVHACMNVHLRLSSLFWLTSRFLLVKVTWKMLCHSLSEYRPEGIRYTLTDTLGMTSSRPPYTKNATKSVHSEIRTGHAQAKHVVYLFNLTLRATQQRSGFILTDIHFHSVFYLFISKYKLQVTVTFSKNQTTRKQEKNKFFISFRFL